MRFDGLRETLLKAGIAPRHVRRYLRELDDHLDDLAAAEREAGHDQKTAARNARARLGGDDELAAAMLARPGFKSWAARWPWLVFGVAPPLTMLLVFFATALPLVLIADLHGFLTHGTPAPDWYRSFVRATALFANLMLGPMFAALLVGAAWRQRLDGKWPILACAIIAIVGAHMVVRFSQNGHRSVQLGIGVLVEFSHAFGPDLVKETPILLAQFLLTLAPALWLLHMRRRQST